MLNPKNQTENDITDFAKELQIIKVNEIDPVFYEMLPLCGLGPAIAYSRFLSLNRKIFFGAHSLINSYRKNHKDLQGTNLDGSGSMLLRSMYFENAAEAYNKMVDYVYIILYFNFELFEVLDKIGKTLNTKDDINKISKKIKGEKLSKIDEWICKNENTSTFSLEFQEYKKYASKLRGLANDIKHNGCIAIEGTDLPRQTKVTIVVDGRVLDVSELVSGTTINMDSEITKLVEIHKKTVELQKKLYTTCNFQKQLKDFLEKNLE